MYNFCDCTDSPCHCEFYDFKEEMQDKIYYLEMELDRFKEEIKEIIVDKAYKNIAKDAKKVETDTKKVLEKDKGRDKLVKKGKEAMKKGC